MDYFHHIVEYRNNIEELYRYLKENKITVITTTGLGGIKENALMSFDIYESHELWPQIKKYIDYYRSKNIYPIDFVNTTFSIKELRDAKWSWIGYVDEKGYPLPSHDFKYENYKVECEKCMIGNQIKPIQISKEPIWGGKHFRRLYGLSELFTKPEVLYILKQKGFTGFQDWDVLNFKTKSALELIKQLFVVETCPYQIQNTKDLVEIICTDCGHTQYEPYLKGTYQYKLAEMDSIEIDFLLMQEWTSNYRVSWREILVSNRVVQFILDQKWQGITFKAIDLV